ncbi:hypothetical protein VTJ49DRAFT_7592 [Mycothermus thermophilus]|uniref:Mechanosensitive ion channel protein Msy1/2-like transmembrane domain-containing protein n=1 Tax=Humicola insolens TaxID=85995 RepID=A0ABR3VHW7_HUMIN
MDFQRQGGYGHDPLLQHNNLDNTKPGQSSSAASMATPPPNYRTAEGKYRRYILGLLYGPFKFVVIFGVVAALLLIPVLVVGKEPAVKYEIGDDVEAYFEAFDAQQRRFLVYYIFGWLLISWLGLAFCYALGTVLPYMFRFVARYVNPAHARYWRIFRTLRRPICITGLITASYIGFAGLIYYNRDDLAIAFGVDATQLTWMDIIDDVLQQGTLWAYFYFLEQVVVLYITIHFHSRSDLGRIEKSKNMQNALIALYDASTYLYPVGSPEFQEIDTIIGNATGAEHGEYRVRATRYLARLGIDTYGLTSFFGNFLSDDPKSHWLRPASSYAIVERAIANPKSAHALARRIWMSLVPVGRDALTAQDIAEVLGPFRREEAEGYFKTLDEGELGDIRLSEMEWTVAEAGRVRNNIYRSMHAADHCINTFDWVMLAFIAAVMTYFIVVYWVPALKDIQETIKFLSFGLAFAVGRSVHHFLAGCVFILFDHPYDIGDRVELWSGQSNQSVSLMVVRTSLLYTVFKRVDTWTELQAGNEWLQQCRIENVSRSGSNRQAIAVHIDVNTPFKSIQHLKSDLEAFLKHPDNKRDYMPNLGFAITGVGPELNKLELRCILAHRTNFSNEPVRAARSMKFMCALVAAVRKLHINAPTLGMPNNPTHYVMFTPSEDAARKQATASPDNADNSDPAAIDLTKLRQHPGSAHLTDDELVRRAVEEAERKRRLAAQREAEELEARTLLGKVPAVAQKGPPAREDGNNSPPTVSGVTTGFQAVPLGSGPGGSGGGAGLRSVPHFKG